MTKPLLPFTPFPSFASQLKRAAKHGGDTLRIDLKAKPLLKRKAKRKA